MENLGRINLLVGTNNCGKTTILNVLAGLESARSDAMIALADLDALFAGSRINGTGGAGAIAASRDEVSALVAEQDRIVATLSRHLGS